MNIRNFDVEDAIRIFAEEGGPRRSLRLSLEPNLRRVSLARDICDKQRIPRPSDNQEIRFVMSKKWTSQKKLAAILAIVGAVVIIASGILAAVYFCKGVPTPLSEKSIRMIACCSLLTLGGMSFLGLAAFVLYKNTEDRKKWLTFLNNNDPNERLDNPKNPDAVRRFVRNHQALLS